MVARFAQWPRSDVFFFWTFVRVPLIQIKPPYPPSSLTVYFLLKWPGSASFSESPLTFFFFPRSISSRFRFRSFIQVPAFSSTLPLCPFVFKRSSSSLDSVDDESGITGCRTQNVFNLQKDFMQSWLRWFCRLCPFSPRILLEFGVFLDIWVTTLLRGDDCQYNCVFPILPQTCHSILTLSSPQPFPPQNIESCAIPLWLFLLFKNKWMIKDSPTKLVFDYPSPFSFARLFRTRSSPFSPPLQGCRVPSLRVGNVP